MRSAYRTLRSGPRRGYRVPHARAAIGVGALCAPGTTVLIPDRSHFPAGACRFAAASPCTPPYFPSTRISLNEASTKGSHVFARPIFPRLWPPGWNGPPLGFPRASHPAGQEPDNARQGRDRPSSTDLELLAQLTSVDLQSGSSLVACDLASHVAKPSSGIAGVRHHLVAVSIARPRGRWMMKPIVSVYRRGDAEARLQHSGRQCTC